MRLLSAIADGLGMLLENSRLSQELQATTGEMQVADEMAQVITSTLNIDEVYEKFAQELRKHVGFDWMNINFIDPDANVLTLKYLVGQAQTGYRVGNVLPLEGTQSQHVMLTGKSLVRDDISNDLSFPSDPTMAELGLRSNIVVPLVTKGRVIASLGLRSKEVGAYGNREKVILERLAKQIAPAIENAELYRQLQASTEEMEVVNEVARIMTSTLHIDQVCEEFAREMRKLVDFERASISMVDREAETYTPQYVFGGPRSNEPIGAVCPLAGAVAATGRTLVREDISSPENGEFLDDQVHLDLGLRSCIALPLISRGNVIGSRWSCAAARPTATGRESRLSWNGWPDRSLQP
jgi:GAF domain-containing protein